jgi:hypothetical protein
LDDKVNMQKMGEHMTHVRKRSNAYTVLVRELEGKRLFGKPGRK